MRTAGIPLVIGIGNMYRHDDAVGLLALRQLRALVTCDCEWREMDGEGAALMEVWHDAGLVVVMDAVRGSDRPGALVRLDAVAGSLAGRGFRASSHAFGLAEAVELSRSLGRMPARLLICGVVGRDFSIGEGLSPDVAEALPRLVTAVNGVIQGPSAE